MTEDEIVGLYTKLARRVVDLEDAVDTTKQFHVAGGTEGTDGVDIVSRLWSPQMPKHTKRRDSGHVTTCSGGC